MGRGPGLPALRTLLAIGHQAATLRGDRPNIDFALAAAALALRLPAGAAQALLAVGRTAGWITHALEQRASGTLLRPRALYIGA